MTVFIFGAGYSARAYAQSLAPTSPTVFGTTRSVEKFDTLRSCRIAPLLFDGVSISNEIAEALNQTTHLIISIAPDLDGDPVLAALGDLRRRAPRLSWIGYLSTVGVYGDHGGGWVDETAICRPVSRRSAQRVAAENAWIEAARVHGIPVALLRLSGIYGPGRNAFVNLAAGTAKRLIKAGQVFNRIHADDIAGALRILAEQKLGGVFNVTDDLPAPPQDVVTFAAAVMGASPPPEAPFEQAELSPMARSFYGENKRVSNAAIKRAGYRFLYPDYRTALEAMWRDDAWDATDARPRRSAIKE